MSINIQLMRNIKLLLLLTGVLMTLSAFSVLKHGPGSAEQKPHKGSRPIIFIENDYPRAFKKAKAEGKYLFVDAYVSWCGPCKQLQQTTFKDPLAADFFNKNFVNLSLDMEKGEGLNMAKKWEIHEYPTLLIVDTNGNILMRRVGYLNAGQLSALGKQVFKK